MKALIATNRPDRFEPLSKLLTSRGHDVRVQSRGASSGGDDASAGTKRSSDARRSESPLEPLPSPASEPSLSAMAGAASVKAGTGFDLAFADLEEGLTPRGELADLRSRAGALALTVALLDGRDADRAHLALDAGFDDVLLDRVEHPGIRIHAWEVRLATDRGRSGVVGGPMPSDRRGDVPAAFAMGEALAGRPQDSGTARSVQGADERAALASLPARRAEDELTSFRVALEGTNVFVFSVDRDMRFSWIGVPRNGFTIAELLGRRIDEPARVQDVRELEEVLRDAIERGAETSREVRSTISGEARRQLIHAVPRREGDGRVVAVDATSIDITELRETQGRLERAQAQYRLLEELSPDMVWSFRSPTIPEYMNPRWTDQMGLALEDLVPENWPSFVHSEDLPGLRAAWMETWERGRPFDRELRLKGRDGAYRWFWVRSSAPRIGADGQIEKLVGAITDVHQRKQAEEALRESEEKFRDLANNMSQMAWMAHPDGERFWANRRWLEYTGLRIEDLRRAGWHRVHHPDHLPRVVAGLGESLRTGMPWEDTFPVRRSDGVFRWFLTRAIPIRDGEGRILRWFGTNTDVTELREAKESAERSHAQLEAVFQAVQDGIVVVDAEGNVRFANQAIARNSGFPSAEDMRLQRSAYDEVFELREPDGRLVPRNEWPIARVLRGERISEWLLTTRRKDTGQEWRQVFNGEPVRDEHGTLILAVLVLRDVTAQMRAEEELRRTSTLLQAIRESSSDLVYAKDRDGRMIMANPANLAMIGKDERDVIGRTDLEFLSDEESARIVMENDRRIMESGQAETLEESVRYPDGTVRIWLSTKTPYRDADGKAIGLLGISREITERKRTEDEVRRERALFSRLIDRLPVLLVIFDAKDGSFRLNEAFRRTLGWSEEEAAQDDLFVLAFPDPEIREQVRNLMATSASGWHDFTAVSKDGAEVPSSWAYLMTDGIRVGIGIDLRERKRAEQELRDTQKLMQGLMDNFPAVIVFKDVAGRFVDCNREFERAIRLPRESILGRTDHELFPREPADRFREADLEAMRSRIPMQSEEVLSIGGVDADFLVIRFPLIDSQGRVYGVGYITHDITERKKADAALRESEGRLRQIVHANPVGMILSDLSGGVFEANDAFLATIGYTRDDLEHGRVRWDAITPPEWLVVDDRHVREALETGTTRPYEKEYVRPDGTRIPVIVGFSTLGERGGLETRAAAFILDLSREKTLQEALRQSEESFRAIAESLPGLVWATTAEGRFEYLNRRWSEYTGFSLEEGLRSTGVDALDPDMAVEDEQKWKQALATGTPYESETRLRRLDGVHRWFLMRALPVHDSHGRIIRWIGTGLDIDDQKRAEQSLQRSKQELEMLVRERTAELERKAQELERSNAELQRFAYIASHDLQEPLRIVVSYAQLLARRYEGRLDESADEYIEFMTRAARHMRHLINDLQTYSRAEPESPRLVPVALSACVREAISRQQNEIRALGAEIAMGPLPLVEGDPDLLRSLFDQLLANALKFHSAEPPRIQLSAAPQGAEWIISMRDNGIGVASEFREAIFQPFRRLHRWVEYPGTGIGLAICRRIAESHGGRIWVESAEGGGSVFRIALPGERVRPERLSPGPESIQEGAG